MTLIGHGLAARDPVDTPIKGGWQLAGPHRTTQSWVTTLQLIMGRPAVVCGNKNIFRGAWL
jgi:hypothetical protein